MADLAVSIPNGSHKRLDGRRSTRVLQAIPLSVSGLSSVGNPFLELTSAVAVNYHGCLYRSRYDNRPGAWVTLQASNATDGTAQPVRAQVRFVRLPASPKELYQVGVELESPANVWGIQSPPEDWVSCTGRVETADDPSAEKSSEPREMSEAASAGPVVSANGGAPAFGTNGAAGASGAPGTNGAPAAEKPVRVVVSSEQLLQKLEGKLQQAAQKAVDSAMTARFSAAVSQAAKAIDDFSLASVRKVQKQCEQYREEMVSSAREQFLVQVRADLALAEERLEKQVETLLGRAEEAALRCEKSVAQVQPAVAEAEGLLQKVTLRAQYEFAARAGEIASRTQAQMGDRTALMGEQQIARLNEQTQSTLSAAAKQLQTKADEARSQLAGSAGEALAELHVAAKNEIERAVGESRQKVESSLASIYEEANGNWEARLRACHEELENSSAQEVQEFRARLHAILNSSMIAATSAVSEHAKALLDVLTTDASQSLREPGQEPSSS